MVTTREKWRKLVPEIIRQYHINPDKDAIYTSAKIRDAELTQSQFKTKFRNMEAAGMFEPGYKANAVGKQRLI